MLRGVVTSSDQVKREIPERITRRKKVNCSVEESSRQWKRDRSEPTIHPLLSLIAPEPNVTTLASPVECQRSYWVELLEQIATPNYALCTAHEDIMLMIVTIKQSGANLRNKFPFICFHTSISCGRRVRLFSRSMPSTGIYRVLIDIFVVWLGLVWGKIAQIE